MDAYTELLQTLKNNYCLKENPDYINDYIFNKYKINYKIDMEEFLGSSSNLLGFNLTKNGEYGYCTDAFGLKLEGNQPYDILLTYNRWNLVNKVPINFFKIVFDEKAYKVFSTKIRSTKFKQKLKQLFDIEIFKQQDNNWDIIRIKGDYWTLSLSGKPSFIDIVDYMNLIFDQKETMGREVGHYRIYYKHEDIMKGLDELKDIVNLSPSSKLIKRIEDLNDWLNNYEDIPEELNESLVSREEFNKHLKDNYVLHYDNAINMISLLGDTKFFDKSSPLRNIEYATCLPISTTKKGYIFGSYNIKTRKLLKMFLTPKAKEVLKELFKQEVDTLMYLQKKNLIPFLHIEAYELYNKNAFSNSKTAFRIGAYKSFRFGWCGSSFTFNVDGEQINGGLTISFENYKSKVFDTEIFDNQIKEIISNIKELNNSLIQIVADIENFDLNNLKTLPSENLKASDFKTIKLSDLKSKYSNTSKSDNSRWKTYIKILNSVIATDPYFQKELASLNEYTLIDFILNKFIPLAQASFNKELLPDSFKLLSEHYIQHYFYQYAFLEAWVYETFEEHLYNFPNIEKLFDKGINNIVFKNTFFEAHFSPRRLSVDLTNSVFVISEGVSDITNWKFTGYGSYVILPSSLTGEVVLSDFYKNLLTQRESTIKFVITPVKNSSGELVSPFTISTLYKEFTDRIFFLEK